MCSGASRRSCKAMTVHLVDDVAEVLDLALAA
jgi:hypothetical protein